MPGQGRPVSIRAATARVLRTGLCLWLIGASGTASATQSAALEDEIKATFLYKFAPFVAWPPSVFQEPTAPIVICMADDDPVSATVEQAASGQIVDGHPIVVRHITDRAQENLCQILYVGGGDIATALDAVRGAPVLTVTGAPPESARRGVINFVIRENHVRFEIDESLAEEDGLTISSKLLSLATSTKPKS